MAPVTEQSVLPKLWLSAGVQVKLSVSICHLPVLASAFSCVCHCQQAPGLPIPGENRVSFLSIASRSPELSIVRPPWVLLPIPELVTVAGGVGCSNWPFPGAGVASAPLKLVDRE